MPTYEYRCVDCGDRVEVFQSFSDPPLQICPVCGGKLRKVFHAVGIQFKGSGFYRSDKLKEPAAKDGKVEKKPDAAAKETAGKAESKTAGDSKPSTEPAKKVSEKSA
jgi:putative FmdB family regulatory protein